MYDEDGNVIMYDANGNLIKFDDEGNMYDENGNMISYDEEGNIIYLDGVATGSDGVMQFSPEEDVSEDTVSDEEGAQ